MQLQKSILHKFPEEMVTDSKPQKTKRSFRLNVKQKIVLAFIVSSLVMSLTLLILREINNFFEGHTFVFRPLVQLSWNRPLSIIKREPRVETVVQIINELQAFDGAGNDIEKYICEKFGPYDCKAAIAIARAESGSKEDAFHANSNGSIDVGVFQINSTHFQKQGCSMKELVNYKQNVDCAYKIWKQQGWKPWAVYTNGSFARILNTL